MWTKRMDCPTFEDKDGYGRDPIPEDFGFDRKYVWELLTDDGRDFSTEAEAAQAVKENAKTRCRISFWQDKIVLVKTDHGFIVAVQWRYSPS